MRRLQRFFMSYSPKIAVEGRKGNSEKIYERFVGHELRLSQKIISFVIVECEITAGQ